VNRRSDVLYWPFEVQPVCPVSPLSVALASNIEGSHLVGKVAFCLIPNLKININVCLNVHEFKHNGLLV
jgi:hypothetical protein